MRAYKLGTFLGLQWTFHTSAIIGSLVLWLVYGLIAYFFLGDVRQAFWAGLVCADIHWLSDILHQSGHALAAKSTGYPQKRWIIQSILLATIYPKNEPELPKSVHYRRALGGVPVSFLIALIAFLIQPESEFWQYIAHFTFWLNGLVFGLGALMPANHLMNIGFDLDGDSLLRIWRQG